MGAWAIALGLRVSGLAPRDAPGGCRHEREGEHQQQAEQRQRRGGDGCRAGRVDGARRRSGGAAGGRSTTRGPAGRDEGVGHADRADDERSAAVGRAVALIDRDATARDRGPGRGAGQSDQGPAVGGAVALCDRGIGDARRERIAVVGDPVTGTDTLVDGDSRLVDPDADEPVGDLDAAAQGPAATVGGRVALRDAGDCTVERLHVGRAGGGRVAGGAMAFTDGHPCAAAARGERVDDGDPTDESKAGRVVDAVAAPGRWGGDRGRGDRARRRRGMRPPA